MAVFSMGDFTFYGDESYGKEDAYAVAGYLASVPQWDKFIEAWKPFAQEEGFTVLHKRLLEHNRKGSKENTEFVWNNLTAEQKAEKRLRINQRACGIILEIIAWPVWAMRFRKANGSEALRSMGQSGLTFSVVVSTPLEFLAVSILQRT